MAQISVINSNHLKQQYRQQTTAQKFDVGETRDVEVNRNKSQSSGPAAILTLSPEAVALLEGAEPIAILRNMRDFIGNRHNN